ncbi:hypothetical protein BIFGAL_03247 [Bifidobacterium gallicum DSM 20093 = LMG 11596]|uniref:Uncharacterized protein n=1 Tax=Bifidobacterium gallicum DSM 20093 = LMG 11596 TaxID=561180 RepID=D1NTT0_9BIFI|nr:hypothetical protein BIFGAL_03247 [Bifidobacterium gallicum DSM 20093 = LMG 11596]
MHIIGKDIQILSREVHMNKAKTLIGALFSTVILLGFIPANANADVIPFKRCDFYLHNQWYDHGIPTLDSCRNMAQHGTVSQLRACTALTGFGITNKP